MFLNHKAQRLYTSNEESNQTELESFDAKLESESGPSYQQALYTEFQNQKVCLIPFGYDHQFATIYAIYGYMLEEEDLNLVRLHLVKTMEQKIFQKNLGQKGISIAYFSKGEFKQKTNKNKKKLKPIEFKDFKEQVLKQIQSKYIRSIKGVYVCHESFITRSINAFSFPKFGIHNQIIDALIKFCGNLEQLVKDLGPLFECNFVKQQVQQYNKSFDWLEIYSDLDKKVAKRKMIEEVGELDNDDIVYKRKISQYTVEYETGIPILLNSLLECIQKNIFYTQSQGIFRKACDQEKLKRLQRELQGCLLEEQILKIASKYDADTLACFIKTFFNKLNPPIVRFDLYDTLIARMNVMYKQIEPTQTFPGQNTADRDSYSSSQEEKNLQELRNKIHPLSINSKIQLPQNRMDELMAYMSHYLQAKDRIILLRLIKFFRTAIIPNQKRNKMGAYNLSVVMGPCIFRPKKYEISDLINSPRMANLLLNLIKNPEKLQ